ncbi:hypothetical protein CNR22_20260 [Sphingobacteriaceae bacterium]|nr:hypothetical protein CNR22_20260 [Sphingobacteriaceae bacterium]
MAVFISIVAFAILVYLINKNSSLRIKQEELTAHLKKLEVRIKKLELNETKPAKETSEIKKEVEKINPPEDKLPDLPFIVTEVVETIIPVEEEIKKELKEVPKVVLNTSEKEPVVPHLTEIDQVVPEIKVVKPENVVKDEPAKAYYTAPVPKPTEVKRPVVKKEKSEFWAKLEKQFIENWTGILGSVIMVVGVGFLGVYAALKISALGRFILISGFAATLGGLFFYLHKKPEWLKLALWLRSSAGAIFLFACAGSIAVPGLKWVETEAMQLVILSSGVLVNLFLGYVGKNQGLASLHVLLSLVGVWILPSSPMTLIIAGLITLFGVALTYREKWDYHLLLTISSFFTFHLLYWISIKSTFSNTDRIYGIITVLSVGVAVALVHYREAYSKKTFERIPFIVHLFNWFYFALSLYLYSNGSKFSTFVLAAGSVTAYLLSRRAKKLDIRWLFLTDSLVAQITAIVAIITLTRWEVDNSIILASIFMEGLLFLVIARKENDSVLYKIGSVAINLIGIALLFYCVASSNFSYTILRYRQSASLLGSAIVGTIFLFYSTTSNTLDVSGLFKAFNINVDEKTKHPILSLLVGIFFVTSYAYVFQISWTIYVVVFLLAGILYFRNKSQSAEFNLITLIFLLGSHFVNWVALSDLKSQPVSQMLIVGAPILLVALLSIKFSFVNAVSKYLNWIGLYLFSTQFILLSYYLFNAVSPLAVSVAWLVLSLIALGTVKLIAKKALRYHHLDRYILHVGYLLIGLFLIRHTFYNLNVNEFWGPLKGRVWTELTAFVVFLIWTIAKNKENAKYKSWLYLQPLMVELVLVFSILSLAYEVNYQFLSLIFLGISGITFALANWKYQSVGRLTLYSFGLFLFAIAQQIYICSIMHFKANNATPFPVQELIVASVFTIMALTYLFVFYKYARLSDIPTPGLLSNLKYLGDKLQASAAFMGVYAFGVFILLITYFMFVHVSEIVPGVIWLLLSPLIATLSLYFYGKRSAILNVDRYMLQISYFFISAFVIRHLLVHIQIESYLGGVKIRLLIELLALAVFTYCATLKKPETTTYKSWEYLHPLLLELLVLFSIFTIALEVDGIWQPLIWVALSFIFSLAGNSKYENLSRFLFYALVLYWVAAFQTAFITSSYVVPSNEVFAQPWVYGSLSLLFQFAFLLYFYLKCSFEKVVLPKSLSFLTELIAKVDKSRNTYVFYPLIICTAIFLFWTFDKSLLTLLWVIECLAIFMISLILKKQHFRYVALGALALCIVRLIFFDLAQSSTLTRAIVFLSVGIIMLVMNSLYNKFKNRFE